MGRGQRGREEEREGEEEGTLPGGQSHKLAGRMAGTIASPGGHLGPPRYRCNAETGAGARRSAQVQSPAPPRPAYAGTRAKDESPI